MKFPHGHHHTGFIEVIQWIVSMGTHGAIEVIYSSVSPYLLSPLRSLQILLMTILMTPLRLTPNECLMRP